MDTATSRADAQRMVGGAHLTRNQVRPSGWGSSVRRPYNQARPNWFAASCPPGGRLVVRDLDVALVFTTAESVNAVLHALIAARPSTASR
jgi:hypothetical protein